MKKLFLFLLAVMPTLVVFSQALSLDDIEETTNVVATTNPVPSQQPEIQEQKQAPAMVTANPAPASVEFYQYSWAKLGPQTRAEINEMAKKSPFGSIQTANIATVRSVTTITGVPSRSGRTMTQYVIVYLDQNGEEHGILTYDNPLASPECPECYIKCVATSPGFHQGDDEDIPHQPTTGENHRIPR